MGPVIVAFLVLAVMAVTIAALVSEAIESFIQLF